MSAPKHVKNIEYEKRFLKQFNKLPAKTQQQTRDRIAAFAAGEHAQRLRDHELEGIYAGYRSINVTGDTRALYYLRADGTVVVFAFVGTHHQLYGK